jgi:2-polyprenyl-3-methyl-5-hydroxy-6-metoxy-1,4-benzoquinol methylase
MDYSEDFLNVAKDKLFKNNNKVNFVLVSLDDLWESHLSSQPDFVFSMSAIHHLENNEKKALYARCFDVLSDGGWFINIDKMKTLNKDAYLLNLNQWVNHVEAYKSNISENKMHFYDTWKKHFDNWKIRNVDNM